MSMAVKLYQRRTNNYKLQMRQVEGKHNPYWHSARLEELSHTLFSFYIADLPRPTDPIMRICYADDITVRDSGVRISEQDLNVNTYLTEMSRSLRANSPLISAPKSSVTLFTPEDNDH